MGRKWINRRNGIIIGAVLAAYTLVGFLLIPKLVGLQLKKSLKETFNCNAAFEPVRFNPYTFQLEIEKFKLSDPDGQSLVALKGFLINFELARITELILALGLFTIRPAVVQEAEMRESQEDAIGQTPPTTELHQRWGLILAPWGPGLAASAGQCATRPGRFCSTLNPRGIWSSKFRSDDFQESTSRFDIPCSIYIIQIAIWLRA
jgi:hypothetical protein